MSKKGQYYQANMLKANGFETPFSIKDPHSPNLNPVGFYSPNRDKYIDLWSNYDMNQYCSMLKWSGLPKNLTSEMLNRMLYYRGSLACFKTAGIVYILPTILPNSGLLSLFIVLKLSNILLFSSVYSHVCAYSEKR